jgi:hypothetical protein
VGAYLVYSASVPPSNAATTVTGAYDIPLIPYDVNQLELFEE